MEQNPAPVNLSALKNILAKSKQVMNKVENISPSTPKNTQRVNESQYSNVGYDERDEREPEYQQYSPNSEPSPLQNFSREHIMASNLPQNVKEAMINKPIAKVSMANTSFSLEDVQDINPRTQLQPQRQVVIQKSVNNNLQKTVARVEPIVEPPRIINNLYPAKVDNNDSTRTVKLNILYPDLSGLK